MQRPFDVVSLAVIDWEFRWQRPQQMMSRLAEEGHRVFYVSPTRFLTLSTRPYELHPLRDNVWEVRLRLPQAFDVYGGVIPPDLCWAALRSLEPLCAEHAVDDAVLMAQLPSWAPLARAARDRFGWPLVYDCMDDWAHFPRIGAAVVAEESRLVREADVLSVSAQRLWDKWAAHSRRPVLARNAADFDRFHHAPAEDPLPDVRGPVAGYFGAIAGWFDVSLVVRLAREHPQVTFVLVGDVSDVMLGELRTLPNVRLTGPQPYAAMPAYLARFDLCLVPFLLNDATRAMDVVKFYEYICQGKPVVATALPELEPYRDALYLAGDAAEFSALFSRALREDDPALRERRIALARENSWGQRVAVVKGALAEAVQDTAGLKAVVAAIEQAVQPSGGPAPSEADRAVAARVARRLFTPELQRLPPADAAREALRHLAPEMVKSLAGDEAALEALSRRLDEVQQLLGEQQEGIDFLKRVRDEMESGIEFLERVVRDGNESLRIAGEEGDRARGELALIRRSRAWRAAEAYRWLRRRVSRPWG